MANEKRLIDANALEQVFRNGIDRVLKSVASTRAKEVAEITLEWCESKLSKAPTVSAVEVVHGEWGDIYTCHGERLWGYKCSRCEQDSAKKSNYCPNCGAKMDGGNEDG